MSKISYEEKVQAIRKIEKEEESIRSIARKLCTSDTSVRRWLNKYESQGAESLRKVHINKRYSKELKIQAVEDYLSGKGSLNDICKKYKINSDCQIRQWIMWYNGHKEFKEPSSAKGEIYMTKGRKTTFEEKIEIVAFCIEHGKDYGLTIETYNVSYQQIYSWVRKYEEKGVEGLTDRRGKAKPENELTDTEKLRQENKILQAKIKDQEMEIALLKKLRELRGGGW